MIFYFILSSFFYLSFIEFFWEGLDFKYNLNTSFPYSYFVILFFVFFKKDVKYFLNHIIKNNLDIFFKYFNKIYFSKINNLNLVKFRLFKLFSFLSYSNFHNFKVFNIYFLMLRNNFFIFWRPLFKKLSYFGFFRINRNKWL